jgi:hypothetical protein
MERKKIPNHKHQIPHKPRMTNFRQKPVFEFGVYWEFVIWVWEISSSGKIPQV